MNNIDTPSATENSRRLADTMKASIESGRFSNGFEKSLARVGNQRNLEHDFLKSDESDFSDFSYGVNRFSNYTATPVDQNNIVELKIASLNHPLDYKTSASEDFKVDELSETTLPVSANSLSHYSQAELISHETGFVEPSDFTAILNHILSESEGNSEQVWRFSLHESLLPVAQIALAGGIKQGQWCLTLTSSGLNLSQDLIQHLDKLKVRLDQLGKNIHEMKVTRENGK